MIYFLLPSNIKCHIMAKITIPDVEWTEWLLGMQPPNDRLQTKMQKKIGVKSNAENTQPINRMETDDTA